MQTYYATACHPAQGDTLLWTAWVGNKNEHHLQSLREVRSTNPHVIVRKADSKAQIERVLAKAGLSGMHISHVDFSEGKRGREGDQRNEETAPKKIKSEYFDSDTGRQAFRQLVAFAVQNSDNPPETYGLDFARLVAKLKELQTEWNTQMNATDKTHLHVFRAEVYQVLYNEIFWNNLAKCYEAIDYLNFCRTDLRQTPFFKDVFIEEEEDEMKDEKPLVEAIMFERACILKYLEKHVPNLSKYLTSPMYESFFNVWREPLGNENMTNDEVVTKVKKVIEFLQDDQFFEDLEDKELVLQQLKQAANLASACPLAFAKYARWYNNWEKTHF